MYFVRAVSPFGIDEGDLFVSHRQLNDSWGPAMPLVELNTSEREHAPSISADGLRLYFTALDNPNYPSPNGQGLTTWVATRSSRGEQFSNPEFFFEGAGNVTPDGLMHFIAGYPEFADLYGVPNFGDQDLYVRTRDSISGDFGAVQHLPAPVNGAGPDCCTGLSAADSTLYYNPLGRSAETLWQAALAESVPVDIKPGGDTAPINLKSIGKLPVAILSTDEFDATQVDAETLLFGDPLLIANGQTPVSPLRWAHEYVNEDDLLDLTLKFSMRDIVGNGVMGPMTVEGYLAGQTFDGMEIAGREMVRIVPVRMFESNLFTVPEPTSLALVLLGLLGVLALRR